MLAFTDARIPGLAPLGFQAPTTISSTTFLKYKLPKHSYSFTASPPFAKKDSRTYGSEDPIDVEAEDIQMRDELGEEERDEEDTGSDEYSEGGKGNERSFGFEDSGYIEQEEEKAYDRDPEFAEILGNFLSDPSKGQSKLEERLRRKRHRILHSKTGSSVPMKVTFNNFDFTNSYIWIEFYNAPMEKDISLVCHAIRSWHIIGRLGGCNSLNMQLSQASLGPRPKYDYVQGANVAATTFYNIGNLEVQENVGRIWVDIGTREPLLLDVLVNALTQISSDFVGIKNVTFGGSEFVGWSDGLKSEDGGCEVHQI